MSNPEITQTKGDYCSICETCAGCMACASVAALMVGLSGYGTVSLLV